MSAEQTLEKDGEQRSNHRPTESHRGERPGSIAMETFDKEKPVSYRPWLLPRARHNQ